MIISTPGRQLYRRRREGRGRFADRATAAAWRTERRIARRQRLPTPRRWIGQRAQNSHRHYRVSLASRLDVLHRFRIAREEGRRCTDVERRARLDRHGHRRLASRRVRRRRNRPRSWSATASDADAAGRRRRRRASDRSRLLTERRLQGGLEVLKGGESVRVVASTPLTNRLPMFVRQQIKKRLGRHRLQAGLRRRKLSGVRADLLMEIKAKS